MKRLRTIVYTSIVCLFVCDSSFLFSLLDLQCSTEIDLFFLIDSTGTLTREGHERMRNWTVNLVDKFAIGTNQHQNLSGLVRVEVIQFWGASPSLRNPQPQVSVDIELGNYNNKNDLQQQLLNLGYKQGLSTIIPDGLLKLNEEIEARGSTEREIYALVLTDGIDDTTTRGYPTTTLEEQSQRLRDKENVEVFAIGFGNVHLITLEIIASHPDNIFTSATLEGALNETYNRMIVSLCGPNSNIPTLPTPGEF